MPSTIRTFIALELPPSLISLLAKVQEDLQSMGLRAKWVRPENIHLTLKFLGDIPIEKCPEIESAIKSATKAFKPLALSVKGIGVFPGIKNARVLWTGLSGEIEVLANLQQNLEMQLVSLGHKKGNRPFKAHLTLGRIKKRVAPAQLLGAIRVCCEFEPVNFNADHVVLYESDLKSTGAVYTALWSKGLG
jgi:2'-5' RNA ligase